MKSLKVTACCIPAISIILAGCAGGFKSVRTASKTDGVAAGEGVKRLSETEVEKRAESFARFATGLSYELNDKSEQALEQYYKSALSNPENDALVTEIARRLLQNKKLDEALPLLRRAAAFPAASGQVLSLLARAEAISGNYAEALVQARNAVSKNPDFVPSYQVAVELLLRDKNPGEAIKLLEKGSSRKSDDPGFDLALAELYITISTKHPEHQASLKSRISQHLERAEAAQSDNPVVLQGIAANYERMGETSRAAAIYARILENHSDRGPLRDALRERLANLYLQSPDKKQAADFLESIVRENPTRYPQVWFFLGTLAYDRKEFVRAADYMEKALLIEPNLEQAYYDLAGIKLNLQQPNEAIELLMRAQARFSQNFLGEFFLGLAHSKLKDYAESLKHFTAAEMIAKATNPKGLNHLFYYHVGAAQERRGNFEEAEKYFAKCLDLSPEFAEGMNYLGYMWADRGENLEKALALVEKAVKLEPENAAFLDSLGWVLFKLKRPEEALKQMLQSLAKAEEPDPTIYDHLGEIYLSLGKNDDAGKAWEKSLELEKNPAVGQKLESLRKLRKD